MSLEEGTPVPVDAGALYDGDEMTAFDPDSLLSVARTNSLIFDLGGSFRVNRIRFFPRMDTANRRRFLQEFSIATSGGEGFNPQGPRRGVGGAAEH